MYNRLRWRPGREVGAEGAFWKMITRLFAILAVLAVMVVGGVAQEYVPGQLLVQYDRKSETQARALFRSLRAQYLDRNETFGWTRIQLPRELTLPQGIERLQRYRFIKDVSPNPIPQLLEVTNDPLIGQQWHVDRISLTQAWDLGIGSASVKIAILDTGVQLDHPDLQSKLVPGYDFGDGDSDPTDNNGHGTHVSGIAAAATNNGIGGVGVGRDCMIMPVKVFGNRGGQALVDGIQWAADQGASVISMSLKISDFPELHQAIQYAASKGVFIVAAAGNDNSTAVNYPAGYPEVMAVASSDPNDSRSGFSTYGNWVDVAAPGSNILSTVPGGGYGLSSGTSMACPVVAGLAGLVWGEDDGTMTPAVVWQVITDTCDPVPGNYVIHGRVNAFKAIDSIKKDSIKDIFHAGAVSAFIGSPTGLVSDLAEVDGQMYFIEGVSQPTLGRGAGIEMTFDVGPGFADTHRRCEVAVSAMASRSVTGMVWAWNVQTQKWQFVRAFPVRQFLESHEIEIKNEEDFVDSNGIMRIRVRGHLISYGKYTVPPFTLRLDQVILQARRE